MQYYIPALTLQYYAVPVDTYSGIEQYCIYCMISDGFLGPRSTQGRKMQYYTYSIL